MEAISKLLAKGAIRPCQPHKNQFISSYFLVPKPDGSYRFILNLKKLNDFIETEHFLMEDIRTAMKLISRCNYMATLDLEDAYLMVPIHESSTIYLRFIFRGVIYEFVALPFGLNVSPYIFTKIMKPITKLLRLKGLLFVVYLDDWWIVAESFEKCYRVLNR